MAGWAWRLTGAILSLLLAGYVGATNRDSKGIAPDASDAGNLLQATVVSTGDGDTLRVNLNGSVTTIRLLCVDSPESNQPGGTAAARQLARFLPVGQVVRVRSTGTDQYGRTLAELYKQDAQRRWNSVNLSMVQIGQAVVYRQYLSACNDRRSQFLSAETQARRARLGFWSQATPIMPWDWRRQH